MVDNFYTKMLGHALENRHNLTDHAPMGKNVMGTTAHRINPFPPDSDVVDCLWVVLQDRKGRTSFEIVTHFLWTDFSADVITSGLMYLYNAGVVTKSKHPIPIFTMKEKAVMPKTAKAVLAKLQFPLKTAQDLGLVEEELTLFERIDLALWELMSDGRWRTVNDMTKSILSPLIGRAEARARLDSLYRGNWFQRRGKREATVYLMRGDITKPIPKSQLKNMSAKFDQAEVVTPKPTEGIVKHQDHVYAPSVVGNPAYTSEEQKTLPEEEKRPVQAFRNEKPALQLPISALIPTLDDGLTTSIWKVMADRRPYSVRDLATLLEDVGIDFSSISAKMSRLHITKDWFIRDGSSGRGFSYTLKPNVEMPVNEPTYLGVQRIKMLKERDAAAKGPRVSLKQYRESQEETNPSLSAFGQALSDGIKTKPMEVLQNPTSENNPQTSLALDTTTMSLPDSGTPVSTAAAPQAQAVAVGHVTATMQNALPVPLIEIKIRIKGIAFTMKEAEDLVPEIKRLGFHNPVAVMENSTSLIQTSITIKGHPFTGSELLEIYRQLLANSIGQA